MRFLALLMVVFTANLLAASEQPIPLGDPKRCLRALVKLPCKVSDEVRFAGKIKDDRFVDMRVLPPKDSTATRRVAACILGHPDYYVPRFLNSRSSEDGVYVYVVRVRRYFCPERIS